MKRHALREDWKDAYVEEKIRPLVQTMNRKSLDIRTIAACQGHLNKGFAAPYVYFICPVPRAALIAKRLLAMALGEEDLNHSWMLEGVFDRQFDLCFKLSSLELNRAHEGLIPPVYTYGIRRSKIDADLMLLARTLDEMFKKLEQCGEIDIPNPYEQQANANQSDT